MLLLGIVDEKTIVIEFLLDDTIVSDDDRWVADLGLNADVAFHEAFYILDDGVVPYVIWIDVKVS